MNAVTVVDIDKFISKLITNEEHAASSIEKILDVLNAAYNWALVREELPMNPVLPIKDTLKKRIQKMESRASNEADVDVLSIEEQKRFEQEARKINPKTGEARKIQLTPEALDDLRTIRSRCLKCLPENFVIVTQTGKANTTTNIEHRMETIYHNAGLLHLKGGVHILRKTFATEMYEQGARVKEIAAYIGDLESTTQKYYIAIRKKKIVDGKEQHVVMLPIKKAQNVL